VNPSKWRALSLEMSRSAARHGGIFDTTQLEHGSGTFVAPADETSTLTAELHKVTQKCSPAMDLGFPMRGPMLADHILGAFHMVQSYTLQPGDNIQMMWSALERLIATHPTLRTTHSPPCMHLCDDLMCELDEVLLAADRANGLAHLVINLSRTVLRARLYQGKGNRAVFLGLCLHHSVLDGPSQQIVYQHVLQLLQAERRGQIFTWAAHSETRLVGNAIAHHIGTLLAQRSSVVPRHLLQVDLPFELRTNQAVAMERLRRHISLQTIAAAKAIAATSGLTLNALLLGTLGFLLHRQSGRTHFAISHTYIGRRLDEMHTVGSFSRCAPLHFAFDEDMTMWQVCQAVLKDTMEQMALGNAFEWGHPVNVAYELNDLRPLARPPEGRGQTSYVKLLDMFFTVNRYDGGYDITVVYDARTHDAGGVDLLVAEWMDSWLGAL